MTRLLVLELTSGTTVTVTDEMVAEFRGTYGGRVAVIGMEQVPECLNDSEAWIEYDTKVRFVPDQEPEAWQQEAEDDIRYPAVSRIYARNVISATLAEIS